MIVTTASSARLLSDWNRLSLKGYRTGTHRLVKPEETVARIQPFLREMGITRVANVTGLDSVGIPVVMVCRPNSRCLAVSQGKGLTLAAAKASGLMEAIECYHAERIDLPLKLGSYEDLRRTHRLVDVSELNRPKTSVYHPDLPLLWVEGHDLLQEEPVWVPYEVVSLDYTLPLPPGSGYFRATGNGLASGNHLLEAISHGICEVVERDAAMLWALAGKEAQDRTRIDLNSVEDPGCREVLDKFEQAGIETDVWEITSDTGIPSFQCFIGRRAHDPLVRMKFGGWGCHPARSIALLRALTEAAQCRLTRITGSRDDMPRSEYERSVRGEDGKLEQAWFGVRDPARAFAQGPSWEADTLDEDLRWELERLRAAGIQRVVVVDLTKPDIDIAVVRVVIPGLEFRFTRPGQFVPGRRAQRVIEGRS